MKNGWKSPFPSIKKWWALEFQAQVDLIAPKAQQFEDYFAEERATMEA